MSEDKSAWEVASDDVNKLGGNDGGFSTIGKCWLGFGWACFTNLVPKEQTFFPFEYGNAVETEAQKAKCQELIKSKELKSKSGKDQHPISSFAICIRKDHVLNWDTARWTGDRWNIYPTFGPDWKEDVMPSLGKLPELIPGKNQEAWLRISSRKSKSGNTYTGKDAEGKLVEKDQLVSFPTQYFPDEASAKVVADSEKKKVDTGPQFPVPYNARTWGVIKAEIKSVFEEQIKNGDKPEEVMDNLATVYEIDAEWIKKAVA
jgi:hypothetical protein